MRDHDHRQRCPKVATATSATIDGVAVTHLRGGQGRGHDRARYGDHAVLRLYRRADCRWRRSRSILGEGVESSFNAITVDSDTSTSDTLMVFATGAAAQARRPEPSPRADDPRLKPASRRRSMRVLLDLAHQVVKDGEGARKFIADHRGGSGRRGKAARRIALSIANSPLVKTAVAGEDANWGRVVMAVGKAGERADRDRLAIWFGGVRVAHEGAARPRLRRGASFRRLMREPHVPIKRRPRPRQRLGDGVDLRSHQGIHRHQRRLSFVSRSCSSSWLSALVDQRWTRAGGSQRPEGRSRLPACGSSPAGKVEANERPEDGADPRIAGGSRH